MWFFTIYSIFLLLFLFPGVLPFPRKAGVSKYRQPFSNLVIHLDPVGVFRVLSKDPQC